MVSEKLELATHYMLSGLANETLQIEDWGGSDGTEEGAENPNIAPR